MWRATQICLRLPFLQTTSSLSLKQLSTAHRVGSATVVHLGVFFNSKLVFSAIMFSMGSDSSLLEVSVQMRRWGFLVSSVE